MRDVRKLVVHVLKFEGLAVQVGIRMEGCPLC